MKYCALLLSLLVTLAGCPAWADGEIVTGPDRRAEIDLRLEELEAEIAEISLVGPQVATAGGALGAVVGVIMFSLGLTSDGCQLNDEKCPAGVVGAGAGLMFVGGATAIAGGVIWGVRAHRLNEIDAERKSLIDERHGLAEALSRIEVRSPVRNGTQFVTLGFRF